MSKQQMVLVENVTTGDKGEMTIAAWEILKKNEMADLERKKKGKFQFRVVNPVVETPIENKPTKKVAETVKVVETPAEQPKLI